MIVASVVVGSLLIAAVVGWITYKLVWPRLDALATEKANVAVELLQFWATAVGAIALSLTLGASVYSFTEDNRQKDRQRQLELDKAAEAQFSEAIRLLEQSSAVSYHGALVIISSLTERQPERFASPSRAVVRTAIRDLERRVKAMEGSETELRLRLDRLLRGYVELHTEAKLPVGGKPADMSSPQPRVDLRYLDIAKVDGAGLTGSSVDLRYTILPNAILGGIRIPASDFYQAKINNAFFVQTDLSYSGFRQADVSGANFTGANLKYVDFEGAKLRDAELFGASMDCAELVGADLTGAHLDIATIARAHYYITTIFPADIDRAAVDAWRDKNPVECKSPLSLRKRS